MKKVHIINSNRHSLKTTSSTRVLNGPLSLRDERQLALAKMDPQAQHTLRHVNAAGATTAMYDGGFQNVAAAHQQLIYYQ
ncbi:hypothetical protein Bca52824_010861 [Brassica carinata]|uniref:Uncharacterized protein n=1 Tax=Brassica carinata TaxID=52824 RepID=A0A8X8BB91_BRACI|nr:hypothetical protein Bca52824_010861 [Brassica carinata]